LRQELKSFRSFGVPDDENIHYPTPPVSASAYTLNSGAPVIPPMTQAQAYGKLTQALAGEAAAPDK